MPDPAISKGTLNKSEGEFRSRLNKMISSRGLIRGTLSTRKKVCGKANCKCASGEKHIALYLMASKDGKQRQLFIPKIYETRVRKWLEQYSQAEKLLEEISDLHWEKIQNREV